MDAGDDAGDQRQRDHQREDPEGELSGVEERSAKQLAYWRILLERAAEIAVRDAPHPFGVTLVEGDIQPLLLQPRLVVGLRQRLDGEAAELVYRDLPLELVAVENGKKDERDDRHDEHHLSKALQDELQHARTIASSTSPLPLVGRGWGRGLSAPL